MDKIKNEKADFSIHLNLLNLSETIQLIKV